MGLAPVLVDQVFEIIARLRDTDDVTIFLVEQNAFAALSIADRGYVLAQGRNHFTDTGEALMANPEVRRSFLGG